MLNGNLVDTQPTKEGYQVDGEASPGGLGDFVGGIGDFEMAPVVDGHKTFVSGHPTSDAFFISDLVPALILLQESSLGSLYEEKIKTLYQPILNAGDYLAAPSSIQDMYKSDSKVTNHLFFDAASMILAGKFLNNNSIMTSGYDVLNKILAQQTNDGIFLEKGGGDSGYQAVSLYNLAEIAIFTGDKSLLSPLQRGMAWELTKIEPNGEISAEGNTRTGGCQEVTFGKCKGISIPEVLRAFALYSALTGDQSVMGTAEKIKNYYYEGTVAVPEPLNILGTTTGLVFFGIVSTAHCATHRKIKKRKLNK